METLMPIRSDDDRCLLGAVQRSLTLLIYCTCMRRHVLGLARAAIVSAKKKERLLDWRA